MQPLRADSSFRSRSTGFTIVELLIVIVVIGILTAITLVAYNGINNRAKTAAAQSAASQAAKKVMTWAVQNNDTYPSDLATAGVTDSGGTTYQYSVSNSASPKTFYLTATAQDVSYYASSTSSSPSAGGCAGHGVGGVAAISNLVPNGRATVATTPWVIAGAAGSTGSNTREVTGGPPGVSPTFYRRTFATPPTSSPVSIGTTAGGTAAISVAGGGTYAMSAYFRTSCAVSGVRIDVTPYDAAGASLTNMGGPLTSIAQNTWKHVVRTPAATVPSNASYMQVRGVFSGLDACVSGDTLDVTAVMVTEGTTAYPFADGDSPSWVWNGTPNNSTSTGPPL